MSCQSPVSDPHPAQRAERPEREDKRGILQRLVELIHPAPDSTEDLIETLAEAEDKHIIDNDSRQMLEGVLRMADLSAGDVMVAAPRMDLLDIDCPFEQLLHQVIETGHSRFPVFEGERENVIGILMAKDLLKLQRAPELNLRALLRPAVFVPESKGLNDLLRQFRDNHQHLAMVIDEFGRTAGLITIEDVLEQIVGEIEDEFDIEDNAGDIYALADRSFRVSGDTSPQRVAQAFGVDLLAARQDPEDPDFDTIGGLIAHEMGHVPKRGESFDFAGLHFSVMHTRAGAVRWFRVTPQAQASQR